MRRIGIVGIENSHVDHFIRMCNTEERHAGNRVVALVGEPSERVEKLRAAGGIDVVVDRPADLIGHVDAAIVASRDGRLHREHASPLLESGIPVLVDKPLATTVDDANALVAAAEGGGVPLVSFSALRFVSELTELAGDDPSQGDLRHIVVTGPADPDSEYAGLFFYGIHHVEMALELLGNPVVNPDDLHVSVTSRGDTTVASTTIGSVTVTFAFVVPSDDARVPFHLHVTRTGDVDARSVTLGPDYNAPALARFVDACERGAAPIDYPALLAPVTLLAAINEALPHRSAMSRHAH